MNDINKCGLCGRNTISPDNKCLVCSFSEFAEMYQANKAKLSAINILLNTHPSQKQIHDACMAYRHDYGLMEPIESEDLRWQATLWLKSWRKALNK